MLYDWFIAKGIRVVIIIAVAVVLYFIFKFLIPGLIRRFISRRMAGELDAEIKKRTDTLSSILITITGVIILIVAVITILPEFGVNIATLIAGIGVGGLAIAFAAQNLVRDFITGFFILFEDQYRIGDVVTIAGISGSVEDITLRRTILRDLDAKVHSIPNGKVEVSTNFTSKYSRVNLNISVGYGENLGRVIEIINRICREMSEDPKWKDDFISAPSVLRVDNLGDSGIDIKILGDTKPARQWDIMGELRLRIKNTFDSEGIEIPWPHTKVYFGNAPAIPGKN
ncbi:MAG: mechanosensitive ion channel family protein [Dehalococcoidales bacterium]|nr:mechanosensitive ion channel family protein [Dehalococcoidales bacterium]